MMRVAVATVLLACVAFQANAERPPFEFKGYKPGDSADTIPKSPDWFCSPPKGNDAETMCINQKETIAGVPAKYLTITTQNGTIKRVSVTFSSSDFTRVAEAIQGKYGPPDSTSNRELQNRMGAKFLDIRMRWLNGTPETGGPFMSLSKYVTSDITQSSLFISILPSASSMKQQQEQTQKKNSEDL